MVGCLILISLVPLSSQPNQCPESCSTKNLVCGWAVGEDGRITSNSCRKKSGSKAHELVAWTRQKQIPLPCLCVSGSCTLNVPSFTAQVSVSLHQRSSTSPAVRTGAPGTLFGVFVAWRLAPQYSLSLAGHLFRKPSSANAPAC